MVLVIVEGGKPDLWHIRHELSLGGFQHLKYFPVTSKLMEIIGKFSKKVISGLLKKSFWRSKMLIPSFPLREPSAYDERTMR